MALTAETAAQVAKQSAFMSRVHFFMAKGAVAVLSEATSTAGHSQRAFYASRVLNGDASILQFSLAVLTNSTLQGEGTVSGTNNDISDSDLEFAINSMFSAFAGFDPN